MSGLVAAFLTLALQDVPTVGRALQEAVKSNDTAKTEENAKHLVVFNSGKAADQLLAALDALASQPTRNDTIYWILVKAAASFSNPDPLEQIAKYVIAATQKTFVARDLMYMLQSNFAHDVLNLCVKVLDKGSDELKVMAIDHLGALQNKEAVPALLAALKKNRVDEVRRHIAKALAAITGQDYGDNLTNWEGWWNANKDKEAEAPKAKDFAGGNVMTGLDKPRENDVEKVKKLSPDMIVVIKASNHDPREAKKGNPDHNFDHIEKVLDKLGVPHIVITKEEFEKDDFKLEGRMMVLINCTLWREHCVCEDCTPSMDPVMRLFKCKCAKSPEVHYPVDYKFTDKAVQKLHKFVDDSGYLFTEDWVLEEVLARKDGWPQLINVGEVLKEQTVGVLPKSGNTSHPYLKRIFAKPPHLVGKGTTIETAFDEIKHQWKIDTDSQKIKIVDPKKVTTLLDSKELNTDNAVAVTFGSGNDKEPPMIGTGAAADMKKMQGGRVMHVLSHFGKQKSESDEYSLQNLLVNFLIEACERRDIKLAAPPPKKR
jgi:hypothetical protein